MYLQEKVNKYYPGASIYEAMEIWSLPANKKSMLKEICDGEKYFAELKKDGNWYEYSKSVDGVGYLFSRGESVKTGLPVECIEKVPHIQKAFESLPNDTVIIGEIYYEGETSNEVRTIMGCLPAKSIARQKEKGNIHFYLHDILKFSGKDLTSSGALERYSILTDVVNEYELTSYDFIQIAEAKFTGIYDFLLEAMANDEEGVVLKLKTAPYAEGKRPAWSMIKHKKQDDIDLICMGFEQIGMYYEGDQIESWQYWMDGEGAKVKGFYYGVDGFSAITKPYFNDWFTSVRLGAYNDKGEVEYICSASSGLSDELKEKISKNPNDYIMKVAKINCMEITKESIRHPILKGFRDDKNAKSCTFKEVFK